MNVIYPYCKGALFDYIKVATLVVYATIETKFQTGKNLPKTLCKNLLKIPQKSMAKIFCGDKNLL